MIIPVYNGEKYISDCIESVLCQVYNDFEIIVIDDGSSDNTAEVCGKFDRIRYFHQENRGVSMARQKGLELAEGEFITFIDGDDTVSPDLMKLNMKMIFTYMKMKPFSIKREFSEIIFLARDIRLVYGESCSGSISLKKSNFPKWTMQKILISFINILQCVRV